MIEYDNIDLGYEEKKIFDSFSLKVEKGEKILIKGPSGCGKTSLFRLLLGFERTDKGQIFFDGDILDRRSVRKVRSNIFYLSQDIDLRDGRVDKVIDEIFGFDLNSSHNLKEPEIEKYLQKLDLDTSILKRKVSDLSGGERQRVGLLVCFLLNRPVLLLDEPTSALDEKMKEKVAKMLTDNDKTVLVISHDEVFMRNGNYREIGF